MIQKLIPVHGLRFSAKLLRSFAFCLAAVARKLSSISLLTDEEKKILARNKQFENRHNGRRAFIIVNGPSLKEQDISCLKNELTFVVSGFYKHDVIKKWQPTYYSILDQSFFNGSDSSAAFFEQLKKVISHSIFFIPLFRGFVWNKKNKFLPEDKTFYIATAGRPDSNIKMDGVVQSFAGVSAFALAQAINMGCSPIYLLGFDHDYLANRGFDRHFYTGGTISGHSFNSMTLGDRVPYDEEMRMNLWLWRNYRSLNRIAKKKGIKIYNATKGGYLDVFERVDFEKLDF